MLSLRRFDSGDGSDMSSEPRVQWLQVTSSDLDRRLRGRASASSGMLQFAARTSDSLPAFIAPFAQPVHVEPLEAEIDTDSYAVVVDDDDMD